MAATIDHVQPPAFLAALTDADVRDSFAYEWAMRRRGVPRISLAEFAAEKRRRGLGDRKEAPYRGRNAQVAA